MTITVLDPWAISGVRYGRLILSNEDDRYYILTDDGAIPVDQERLATTLDSALIDYAGCDHLLLVDDAVEFVTPGSPEVVGSTFLGGALYACHSPGVGTRLITASGHTPFFSYQEESVDFFAALSSAMNDADKRMIDRRIAALKAAGVWDLTDLVCFFDLATRNDDASLRNIKDPAHTLTLVNTPSFTVGSGFAGVIGTSSYINTGWDPVNNGVHYTQNSAFMAVNTKTNLGGSLVDFGATKATLNGRNASDNLSCGANMTGTATVASPGTTSVGVSAWNRDGASSGALYRDGVQVSTFTTASEALVAVDFYVCAQNNSGSPSSVSNRVVAGIAAGGSLSTTQHAALAAAMVLA